MRAKFSKAQWLTRITTRTDADRPRSGATRPGTYSLSPLPGVIASNEVTTAVGTNGQISIYNVAGTVNVVVDVLGYFNTGGAGMNAITPTRAVDTRAGSGKPYAGQPVPANGSLTVQISGTAAVPTGASTAILQTTVITPTAVGTLTTYPAGTTRPPTSSISYKIGLTSTSEITAALGTTPPGAVTFYNASAAAVNLTVDVTGYINSAGDALTPLTSARIADTRTGTAGPYAGQTLTAAATLTIQATGRGGIPANARTVVVNLIAMANTTTGTLTIYPGGTRPATTSLTRTAASCFPDLHPP